MKVPLAIAAAVAQVLVLAFMGGQREWIARTGTPLTLRTAPIDPNDPMRGAYVRLNYEVNSVPAALCRGETAVWLGITDYRKLSELRDRIVYAALKVDDYGLAELVSLDTKPPESGPFLRGRIESTGSTGLSVRYGIEAMFTSKIAALDLENTVRNVRIGAPMDVHIATGSSGISVLKSYEWEPLGITIGFDRPPPRDPNDPVQNRQPPRLTGLTVTLHNYSDHDVAIVDLPGAGSFRLIPNNRFGSTRYAWVGEGRMVKLPAPQPDDIIVLKPGSTHSVHLDLTEPRWWVIDTSKPDDPPKPMQEVESGWTASFRIEYAPPDAAIIQDLPNSALVRHTPLRSRAFNANQGVD